ncbi:MAG: hypothetical protein OXE78_09140, partial [Gammaproteobacteria bacterium]|nr:hypothetical protein [Gammaproteobacteria bacterium]MCY4357748.1 hypothetical protein [Gammaproteobacteria bacterium]
AVEGRVCNLLQRMVAAEIVQHKLIKASTNIGHCHGLLRSYQDSNRNFYRRKSGNSRCILAAGCRSRQASRC